MFSGNRFWEKSLSITSTRSESWLKFQITGANFDAKDHHFINYYLLLIKGIKNRDNEILNRVLLTRFSPVHSSFYLYISLGYLPS